MKQTLTLTFGLFTIFTFLSSPVKSAIITWTDADVNSISDINTTGTLVEAVNFAGTGGSDVTVTASDGSMITFMAENGFLSNNFNGDVFAGTTMDPNYDALLSQIDFGPNAQNNQDLPLTGLTVGQQYIFQFWYVDDGGLSNGRNITLSNPDDAGDTNDVTLNGDDFAIGTFTADATTQNINLVSSANGLRATAYQLRVIPEVSTAFVLCSLLIASSILFRKRRAISIA